MRANKEPTICADCVHYKAAGFSGLTGTVVATGLAFNAGYYALIKYMHRRSTRAGRRDRGFYTGMLVAGGVMHTAVAVHNNNVNR
jgi:hypothetical protein